MRNESAVILKLESEQFPTGDIQIRQIHGREYISRPFWFDIDIVCAGKDAALVVEDVVAAEVCLTWQRENGELRRIYGMIASVVEQFDVEHESVHSYRLRMVPRTHRLDLVRMQECYLDMSDVDVIRAKLENVELGDSDYSFVGLYDTYAAREFIVQYDETDMAFVSRLAEHLGIAFHYDHADGRDRIVFTDSNAGFAAGEEQLRLKLRTDEIGVSQLRATSQTIPEMYVVMDYNYRTPNIDLTSQSAAERGYAGGVCEWGGHFKTQDQGKRLARVRREERECTRVVFEGQSDIEHLTAGEHYPVEGHQKLEGLKLLLTEVEHKAAQPVLTHGGSSDESDYQNTFYGIDVEQAYRPPRITPRPRIAGLLTGVVEAKTALDVERYARMDGEGRYWIKFLYDNVPLGERRASRPIRRAQPTVGADYGMHFPLRPGVEVVLAFVNGDPDRPIIVGAVHNTRTPNPITDKISRTNVIKTASGISMRFKDD